VITSFFIFAILLLLFTELLLVHVLAKVHHGFKFL